jgi:hypothetical protein
MIVVNRLLARKAEYVGKKKNLILLTNLISISHRHQKIIMVFVGEHNKWVVIF